MVSIRNKYESIGRKIMLEETGYLPPKTDEDYIMPAVDINEAILMGRKEVGKRTLLGASYIALAGAMILLAANALKADNVEQPRQDPNTPQQCPVPYKLVPASYSQA